MAISAADSRTQINMTEPEKVGILREIEEVAPILEISYFGRICKIMIVHKKAEMWMWSEAMVQVWKWEIWKERL